MMADSSYKGYSHTVSADDDTVTSTAPDPQEDRTATPPIAALLSELKDTLSYLISAKVDRAKASVRQILLYAVLGVAAALIGGTTVIVATVLLLKGLADSISAGVGKPWAGDLIVGVVILAGGMAAILVFIRMMSARSRRQTELKYTAWQKRQRAKYGNDVHERAINENSR